MPINLSQIRNELLPGLRGITGQYPQIPTQWSKVFRKGNSKMAVERTSEMRFFGLARRKAEGQATHFDNEAGDRFVYNQRHQAIALGYATTREAIADNLYKSEFPRAATALNDSHTQTKEILGADVLNTAFVYNPEVGGDGVSLCNTAHPIDTGDWANRPVVDVELNEAALENAQIQIRYFRDQAGMRMMARGPMLIVPPQLQYVAKRLLETDLRPGTSDNDINAVKDDFKDGYLVMDFLTSPTAWFIKTTIPGLLYLEREPYDTDMFVDSTGTQNLMTTTYERYSFSYDDPRGLYGSAPTV